MSLTMMDLNRPLEARALGRASLDRCQRCNRHRHGPPWARSALAASLRLGFVASEKERTMSLFQHETSWSSHRVFVVFHALKLARA